jgi:hypothetical protein
MNPRYSRRSWFVTAPKYYPSEPRCMPQARVGWVRSLTDSLKKVLTDLRLRLRCERRSTAVVRWSAYAQVPLPQQFDCRTDGKSWFAAMLGL